MTKSYYLSCPCGGELEKIRNEAEGHLRCSRCLVVNDFAKLVERYAQVLGAAVEALKIYGNESNWAQDFDSNGNLSGPHFQFSNTDDNEERHGFAYAKEALRAIKGEEAANG